MIQDIEPHIYNNTYQIIEPRNTDYVFVFHQNQVLLITKQDVLVIPTWKDLQEKQGFLGSEATYLFSIDDVRIFLLQEYSTEKVGTWSLEDCIDWEFKDLRVLRNFVPKWLGFAGITANHLNNWYRSNRFCGCCGQTMEASKTERAMRCPNCGFIDYPKICPAIIVGITHEDKILMTRYANRSFKRYALVAGFCEIGETLEDTVRREVMEEVGVKVKNIRYYSNQPWGFSSSLLIGFFAELDGDDTITMDAHELAEAKWFTKEEIPEDEENGLSLTYTMMMAFKNGDY